MLVRCPMGICILHHDPDLHDISRVRKLQHLPALLRHIEVGEDAVHVPCLRGSDDAFIVIYLKLKARTGPQREPSGKLYVISGKLTIHITVEGLADPRGCRDQMELRVCRFRNVRHGHVMLHQPPFTDVVKGSVLFDLPEEFIDLILQVRDLRNRGDGHCTHIAIADRRIQQPDPLQPVPDRQLHIQPVVDKGIQLALGDRREGKHEVLGIHDLRLWEFLLYNAEFR